MNLVSAPDPKLRIKTKTVKKINPALLDTLKKMVKLTQEFKDPEGVGLASTQVGLDERFFVTKSGKKFLMVINPKILAFGKRTKKYFEGCLSTPNIWGEVRRHFSLKVSYQDESGKTFTKTLTGLPAHIFQHEVDHLDGILFQDRVLEQKGKFFRFSGKDKAGADTYEEISLP